MAKNASNASKEKKQAKPYKKGKQCPKCNVRLAEHKDRLTCGKCNYMQKKQI